MQCDFIEEVWEKKSTGELQITKWSGESLNMEQKSVIGNIEEAWVVNVNNHVWETPTVEVARIGRGSEEEITQWQIELKPQLVIGDMCSEEERVQFEEFPLINITVLLWRTPS